MKSFQDMKLEVMGEAFDSLISADLHARGIVKPIYDVLRKKVGRPLTYHAAKGFVDAVKPGDVVFIGTGFLIAPSYEPETDGPIAAALMARAIDLYGAKPIIVAEEGVMNCLKGACPAAELNAYDDVKRALAVPHSVGLVTYPADKAAAQKLGESLIKDLKPKAMITVEHPGLSAGGTYNSGLGKQLDPWVAPVDQLLVAVRKSGGFTIGIGDLGNECGMGCAMPELAKLVPYGDKIASVVECDAPIMAVISEFGAYGFIAALEAVSGKKVLHDIRVQEATTRTAVLHGAVEGCTGVRTPALDMIDIRYCNAFIEMLHTVLIYTEAYSSTRPFFLDFVRQQQK